MRSVIELRRFLHQLPKEVKKASTKIKQAVLQKNPFHPIATGYLFSAEGSACGYGEAAEYSHRGNDRTLGSLTKQVEKLKIKFSCILRPTTGIVGAVWLEFEEGSGDGVGADAMA